MGALRLSGETSWKKAQQVQGSWDRTLWAEVLSCIHSLWVAGGLINGQAHPLRAEGRQRARAPPGGAGGKSRFHLPPSFCVLGHCSLALDRGTSVYREREGVGNKGPPQSQHSWIPSGCGDELERLMGEDGKEACLRTWNCFLNGVGGGVWGCP